MANDLEIIYEDNHIIAVVKPAGLLVQGDSTGDTTALEMVRSYIKDKYKKPGNVYVGLVHRIDRPVSGVVVFARTSKAASRMTRAFQEREVKKTYLAIVEGLVDRETGTLEGFISREENRSRLVPGPSRDAKEVSLTFKVIEHAYGRTLLEITPATGRHHQIRVQLSAYGYPIAGDLKYGSAERLEDMSVALHAARLRFQHPVQKETVTLQAPPPNQPVWQAVSRSVSEWFSLPPSD